MTLIRVEIAQRASSVQVSDVGPYNVELHLLAVQSSSLLLHDCALIGEGRVVVALLADVLAQDGLEDGRGDALLHAGGAAPGVLVGDLAEGGPEAVDVPTSGRSSCRIPA